jgi:ribonuclease T1
LAVAGSNGLLGLWETDVAYISPNEQSDEAREKFTTKEFDVEGGMNLDYFGARYYDPEIGRFISTDPMDQFWDSYSYCGGDPVNNVDPDGEDGIPLDALNLMTPTTAASISQTMASGAEMEMEFNLNYGMEAELFAPIAYIPDRAPNIGTLSTTEIPTSGWDIRSSLASASFPGDIPQATLTMPQMPTIEGEPSFGAGHSLLSDNSIASAISGQVHSQLQILGPATHIIMGAVGLGLPGGGEMAAAEDVAKIAALPFKDAGISSRVGKSLEDIAAGVKNFKKDGTVFKNLEGRLPAKPQGYYKEYTVPTPGATNRGAQRIVQGANGETYYTLDHYKNFVQIR